MARAVKDYYRVLGLTPDADQRTIDGVFRNLIRDLDEEDAGGGEARSSAAELRSEIVEAYGVLGDRERRKAYDELRRSPEWWVAIDTEDASDGEEEDSFDGDSLLEHVLGQFMRSMASAGEKEIAELRVPFEAAALGGRARLRMPVRSACPVCGGTGAETGGAVVCPECRGEGSARGGCERCGGNGWEVIAPCDRCDGAGWVSRLGVVSLKIPAGVSDGTLIPVPGFGGEDEGSPSRGKYFRVRVSSHPFFSRDGRDILCKVSVSEAVAKRGTTIRVRTIRGRRLNLRVPPNTRDGTVIRLTGEGIEAEGDRGDQLVEIRVTPRQMTRTGGDQ